jgi:hypothetical protein
VVQNDETVKANEKSAAPTSRYVARNILKQRFHNGGTPTFFACRWQRSPGANFIDLSKVVILPVFVAFLGLLFTVPLCVVRE